MHDNNDYEMYFKNKIQQEINWRKGNYKIKSQYVHKAAVRGVSFSPSVPHLLASCGILLILFILLLFIIINLCILNCVLILLQDMILKFMFWMLISTLNLINRLVQSSDISIIGTVTKEGKKDRKMERNSKKYSKEMRRTQKEITLFRVARVKWTCDGLFLVATSSTVGRVYIHPYLIKQ